MLKMGKGAILLVPEISLTPQTVKYFSRRMGDQLAILHSRLTKAEKINEWHRILSGEKRIVIGARSAIFAPLNNIGIILSMKSMKRVINLKKHQDIVRKVLHIFVQENMELHCC